MRINFQRDKNTNYSVINNTLAQDIRVGPKARGVWLTVMSLPDTWNFSIEGLRTVLPMGRDSMRMCLRELCKYGYCVRKKQRDKGQFIGVLYTFIEKPRKLPRPEKPSPVKPEPVFKSQSSNKDNQVIKESISLDARAEAGPHVHEGWYDRNGIDYASPEDTASFDDWVDSGVELLPNQPVLLPSFLPKEKRLKADPIPEVIHTIMYRLCFRAETNAEQLTLTSLQRGKVASVVGHLRDTGANFERLHLFEAWWVQNWRSTDRATQQYQAPRPEQVLEHWNEAMKSGVKPKVEKIERPKPTIGITDLTRIMRQRAEARDK